MSTTAPTKDETVRKINRHVAKYLVIRIATGVGVTVAGCLIANAIDRKLNGDSDENTSTNE